MAKYPVTWRARPNGGNHEDLEETLAASRAG
jgi:hypothetical protein